MPGIGIGTKSRVAERPLSTGAAGVSIQRQTLERQRPLKELLALPVMALDTTGVTLFTVPDNADFQIQYWSVVNYSGSAATYDVNIVPSGGSKANSNVIYSARSVGAGATDSPHERWGMVIPSGSDLIFTASVNSALNVLLSGVNIYGGALS